jgi:1D-myo-inositol-triphosphate 3-kinase
MLDNTELEVYKRLTETYYNDPIYSFTPFFYGEVKGEDESGKPIQFIRIANLLTGYFQPKVIDIKLGVRTFMESECDNPKPRPDLYKRMLELYPDDLTEEEKQAEAITKYRWMTARDEHTTISSLGFRVDGIAGYRHKERDALEQELTATSTMTDVVYLLTEYTHAAATDCGEDPSQNHEALDIAQEVLARVEQLYDACKGSSFVKKHEFIGSSLLIIADAYGHAGVAWIDFAKTTPPPDGIEIDHASPWVPGNHEDGILTGLSSLVEAWKDTVDELRAEIGLSEVSSMGARGGFNPCRCLRFRRALQTRSEARRVKESLQSDLSILSDLPSFQGRRQVQDPRKMRNFLKESTVAFKDTTVAAVSGAAHMAADAVMAAHDGALLAADSFRVRLSSTSRSGDTLGARKRTHSEKNDDGLDPSLYSSEPQAPTEFPSAPGSPTADAARCAEVVEPEEPAHAPEAASSVEEQPVISI